MGFTIFLFRNIRIILILFITNFVAINDVGLTLPSAGGPAYYLLHPQKGIAICLFFLTYQAFKNREGIISRKILAEWLKI